MPCTSAVRATGSTAITPVSPETSSPGADGRRRGAGTGWRSAWRAGPAHPAGSAAYDARSRSTARRWAAHPTTDHGSKPAASDPAQAQGSDGPGLLHRSRAGRPGGRRPRCPPSSPTAARSGAASASASVRTTAASRPRDPEATAIATQTCERARPAATAGRPSRRRRCARRCRGRRPPRRRATRARVARARVTSLASSADSSEPVSLMVVSVASDPLALRRSAPPD